MAKQCDILTFLFALLSTPIPSYIQTEFYVQLEGMIDFLGLGREAKIHKTFFNSLSEYIFKKLYIIGNECLFTSYLECVIRWILAS